MDTGANFSDCGLYRYLLWRIWDEEKPRMNFLMLNPSTADERENDPTVERCQRRAMAAGYGGLYVTNLFAYRSTDPAGLSTFRGDPIGPLNNSWILWAARQAKVICAWGNHGKLLRRDEEVIRMLRAEKTPLHALRLNAGNIPAHPLYIPYSEQPVLWGP